MRGAPEGREARRAAHAGRFCDSELVFKLNRAALEGVKSSTHALSPRMKRANRCTILSLMRTHRQMTQETRWMCRWVEGEAEDDVCLFVCLLKITRRPSTCVPPSVCLENENERVLERVWNV